MTPILVWRFHEAPKAFQALSTNGGDEDWVVFVPLTLGPVEYMNWLYYIDSCQEPQRHEVPHGTVFIGSHA